MIKVVIIIILAIIIIKNYYGQDVYRVGLECRDDVARVAVKLLFNAKCFVGVEANDMEGVQHEENH